MRSKHKLMDDAVYSYFGTWSYCVIAIRVDDDGRNYIPKAIKRFAWFDRLFNRHVIMYRDGEVIHNCSARKL